MATEAPLILLVDSDSQWLEATSNYLFREGIDSLTATEGKKSPEYPKESNSSYDSYKYLSRRS